MYVIAKGNEVTRYFVEYSNGDHNIEIWSTDINQAMLFDFKVGNRGVYSDNFYVYIDLEERIIEVEKVTTIKIKEQ